MAKVIFTPTLKRHISCPEQEATGSTVRSLLDAVLAGNRRLSSYILDDQGMLRKHVVIFIDGQPIQDRETLSDQVPEDGEVFVMQALSGGA